MRDITIAILGAYSGNKGAAAMLQSSVKQLYALYGPALNINLMSVYPDEDRMQIPYDFIRVAPAKPERVLFIAFPLALLYRLFRWFKPAVWLLSKNKIIRAYLESDIVLDEAGIAFVDSRGFVMNTYAAVMMLLPLLLGLPVVKYSQALGSFSTGWNRFLAKLILPKLALICARGEITRQYLEDIGVTSNVTLCADGAFSMPDDEATAKEVEVMCEADAFYSSNYISLSLSSVVDKRCEKLGIDYRRHMIDFINGLTDNGYGVLLIANAARKGSEQSRNNDLPLCKDIFTIVRDNPKVRFYDEEMSPEKIRELIGKSEAFVGSRFHAMIAALARKKPVLLIGWSHKYKEVLDMFGLGAWSVDYSEMVPKIMMEKFSGLIERRDEIAETIEKNWPSVLDSSHKNIRAFKETLERLGVPKRRKPWLLDTDNPERYVGEFMCCRAGYAADGGIRENAASGGMVTALLCHLLQTRQIDGAWVTRSFVKDGELTYHSFVATTAEEIKSCSGSIYMDMPLMKHATILSEFQGRVAVVLMPCQMRGLNAYLKNKPELSERLVLKIALFCSVLHGKECMLIPLKKKGIALDDVCRIIFRRGHYRGKTYLQYIDGSEQSISYTRTLCAYKHAYFYAKSACLSCQDHFGRGADLSFGDIWLKEMKANPIKHTCCVIRSETGRALYESAVKSGVITDGHFSAKRLLRTQKRPLVFKYNCAKAKGQEAGRLDTGLPCRWNHRLAYALISFNQSLSAKRPGFIQRIPMWTVFYYMCFIRFLLNF